jgi:hypothetical protein
LITNINDKWGVGPTLPWPDNRPHAQRYSPFPSL